jgi:sugar phosphate isomerase/epimerase
MGSTYGATIRDHIAIFRQQIELSKKNGAMLYNCHSGSDLFSMADAKAYFDEVLEIEKSVGLPVAHETHRKRLLFHPVQARDLLNLYPTLKICADFSHWVCVCGRLLEDCQDIIDLAASRAIHIHARVGYSDGPQVSDPRAPEYLPNVLAHENWWDAIWNSQAARGMTVSTLNPEFGPANYMHLLPYTQQPVVSLWEITKWMADRQAVRFVQRQP